MEIKNTEEVKSESLSFVEEIVKQNLEEGKNG